MKKSKLIHILCSMMIGVLLVIFVLAALILSGVIRITRTDLVIATESGEALYDGTPLTNHNWSLKKGKLKSGHTISVTFKGSQTDVGESENTVEVVITDELGADVTGDYNIEYDLGTLKVNPRAITITSASDTKVYDGYALKNDGYEITSEQRGLVSGHSAVLDITGQITDVGETANTVNSVIIYDEKCADVTRNYQIFVREGILRVTTPFGTSTTPSFDGSSSLLSGAGYSNAVLYTVYSNINDTVYLKIRSYGDYAGRGWSNAAAYGKLIDDTYAASYLTSFALKDMGAPSYTIEIKSNYQPYALPYYVAPDSATVQTNDTASEGGITKTYAVNYYRYSNDISPLGSKYSDYESEYRSFVYEEYLTLDDESRKFMEEIIASQGFSADDSDIVNKVANYIKKSAVYNKNYNTAMDSTSNIVIAFLEEYKEGVCRHYASAAVLLYRALGIPARYTVGVLAELKANQWNNVTADSAHAWVEVYIDGIGWINVEVTGSSGGGSSGNGSGGSSDSSGSSETGSSDGTGSSSESSGVDYSSEDDGMPILELYPATVRKKYDGKTLYATNKVRGFEAFEKLGYTYTAEVVGERTELGVTRSSIKKITLYNEAGKDVTSEFDIKLFAGRVHVYSKIIYFKSDSYTVSYDGKALEAGYMTGGELTDGHRCSVKSTANVNAGLRLNTFDVTVYDENGQNVTDIYYVAKTYGVVNILPIEITVKADDATKKYDGTALTCESITVTEGALLEEHQFGFCKVTGSQTDVGRSENVVEYISVYDSYGKDVTSNYIINLKPGKLRVTNP